MPSHRYRSVYERVSVPLTDRCWPSNRITTAPLWVPVDLRDGNQALAEPMDPERKRIFFRELVAMGYKEIEVGYPSASQTDYDFVRLIAESDLAPEDVTIVVFTPARPELIARTMDSVRGIRNDVVIHMYAATAPVWRETVLALSRAELTELVVTGGRAVAAAAGDRPNIRFQFSPEVFILTEPDFVLELCDRMTALWDASPERPVTLNLPATVEVATPNVYADQIEYMHRHLSRRDGVILSVHPHNDRGTGVACAELAVLAGAQRVEGCVFGNGERTGNVDLAILALNLHAQGVDPMVDFSDIDRIRRTVEHCTRMPIHERHPYVGDLVYTAYSGTHQDAIKKGFAEHRARAAAQGRDEREIPWRVPYLPIDPADVGRSYEAVIRVNSQSGKGGIAYLLHTEYGFELPRRLQIDFARHVQRHADETGSEISASTLRELLMAIYSPDSDRIRLLDGEFEAIATTGVADTDSAPHAGRGAIAPEINDPHARQGIAPSDIADPHAGRRPVALDIHDRRAENCRVAVEIDGRRVAREIGDIRAVDAVAELIAEYGPRIEILAVIEQAIDGATCVVYLEYRVAGDSLWAIGIGRSPVQAVCRAVVCAAGRALSDSTEAMAAAR
ncbi:2-isopropylmalate synthase [Nocardia sp. CDC159]|uniref:2-isopropylmalate synthase n=1 Tax=Nocardia pulmonis TaxID=2951408 RepID=A0A9X2ECD7_9NOCA|nr:MULTISPECIES: 2-isopropylmalate synthase [Nocardia]MCM6778302.1 2-isopropylmalate synthase [Nocardia pulmonis]MCM6791302.1 2-isopropylmalate synthase [Nocardia sp. CDC159]